MQRGLAQSAAYENADTRSPVVGLTVGHREGDTDYTAANQSLQARSMPSVQAMQRGRARSVEYSAVDASQHYIRLTTHAAQGDFDSFFF